MSCWQRPSVTYSKNNKMSSLEFSGAPKEVFTPLGTEVPAGIRLAVPVQLT
jgi:hypothetical protein